MFGNVDEWTMDHNLNSNGVYDPELQCASGSDYSDPAQYASGQPLGSYYFSTCGQAGSQWPMIGFRPIRNAITLTPIMGLLLQ